MKSYLDLPAGYVQYDYVNLKLDRTLYRRLNGLSFLVGAAVIAAGWAWRTFAPLKTLLLGGFGLYYARLAVLLVALWLCVLARRGGQGLLFGALSGLPSQYRRVGLTLNVGNEACFSKGAYLLAMLLPTCLVAAGLIAGAALVPGDWFWCLWGALAGHLGGAVGDLYFAVRALRLPAGALLQDTGYGTCFFREELK